MGKSFINLKKLCIFELYINTVKVMSTFIVLHSIIVTLIETFRKHKIQ